MIKNPGIIGRVMRVVLGVILIAIVFAGPKSAWGWVGGIPIIIAFIGWCPPDTVLGIGTRAAPG